MKQLFCVNFDIEPVAKGRPRFWNGRTLTDKKTRAFEKNIALFASSLRPKEILTQALSVSIDFYFAKPPSVRRDHVTVRPDLDNLTKAILDSLNGIYWVDDSQIVELECKKLYGHRPAIIICVGEPD